MTSEFDTTCLLGGGGKTGSRVVFHPAAPQLAAVGLEADRLSIVDCPLQSVLHSLLLSGEPGGITFDSTGQYLMAVYHDRVLIWNLAKASISPDEVANAAVYDLYHSAPVFCVGKDGVWILLPNEWQQWSVPEARIVSAMPSPQGERLLASAIAESGICMAVTYDEQLVNHPEPTLSVWELNSKKCCYKMPLKNWQDVLVAPGASTAVIPADQSLNCISVWDLQTCRKLSEIRGVFAFSQHSFCADGKHLITSVPDDTAVHWTAIGITDLSNGVQRFVDPCTPFPPAIFASPFVNYFVTVVNDRRHPVDNTSFWNPVSGQKIGWTTGHPGHSPCVGFSRCGGWFVSTVHQHDADVMTNPIPTGSIVMTDLRRLADA